MQASESLTKAFSGRAARLAGPILAALTAMLASGAPARADYIKNPTAVFAGLDKVTGRIIKFDVAVNETVQFGSLQITPRACYTRPATEAPLTDAFVEVDEVTSDHKYRRIFSGWMFAASPGLHGVEHPVYDAWVTDCKGGTEVVHSAPEAQEVKESQFIQPLPKPSSPQPPRQSLPRPSTDPSIGLGAPIEVGAAPGMASPPRQDAGPRQAPQAPQPRRAPSQSFFPSAAGPIEDSPYR
jgi:hypothetical protein